MTCDADRMGTKQQQQQTKKQQQAERLTCNADQEGVKNVKKKKNCSCDPRIISKFLNRIFIKKKLQ